MTFVFLVIAIGSKKHRCAFYTQSLLNQMTSRACVQSGITTTLISFLCTVALPEGPKCAGPGPQICVGHLPLTVRRAGLLVIIQELGTSLG